jgi:ABC-type transport system involved in multi-copper enzyme maturation permease subunit
MLWYKAWLETRWRFLIGLALLILSATGTVFAYPRVVGLLAADPKVEATGELGRRVIEAIELSSNYRGYVWAQWFRQNLPQMWTLFAVLIGTGGLLSQASGGGALFTLSLPVTRERLLAIRAATGLAELGVLAFVPSLFLVMFSPAIGQSYSLGDALVQSTCVFVAGTTFFSLAFLLSTVFSDVWRPALLACLVAVCLAVSAEVVRELWRYSILRVMTAETYFRDGRVPWLGLIASAALSAAMLYAAARNISRQDF